MRSNTGRPSAVIVVQDFSAELDLRDLPGEAAGFEFGACNKVRFCQVFLRAIHYFSPSVPFRPDNRAPPHTSRKGGLSGPTTAATGRRPLGPLGPVDPASSSASFAFVYALVGGSVKALPAVFSGALLVVFK